MTFPPFFFRVQIEYFYNIVYMRIVIISDSHGSKDRLSMVYKYMIAHDLKCLFHAGDFAEYGVEEVIGEYASIQTYISLGNCDINKEVLQKVQAMSHVVIDSVIEATIDGLVIGMSHIEGIAEQVLKMRPSVFIHGHTHRKKSEQRSRKLILNPGSLMEDPTFFILDTQTLQLEQGYLKGV